MALKITANADYVVKLAVDYGRLDNFGHKGVAHARRGYGAAV